MSGCQLVDQGSSRNCNSPGMADGQHQLPTRQPVLLLMKGHPGSGKSSVAEQLAGAKSNR